jgi:predicted transcriptional regulator
MKSVLISIQPKWCELIASGKKTVEVRKTRPKLEPPFKCYIYCTNGQEMLWILNGIERAYNREKIADIFRAKDVGGAYRANGKVIGEFVCDDIAKILNFVTHFGVEGRPESELNTIARASCLDYMDMLEYLGTEKDGYAWHISDLKIYDHPKKLSEFCSYDARLSIDENGFLMPTHEITRPPQSWCYVKGGE